ncbi:unnamed protein product [Durusdinium trenchii]|uniref:Uncharacterized protein n=1 Tax=Durusdinium trenchii TaxID=1381693 RepID=A0ABP0PWE8_9DINO
MAGSPGARAVRARWRGAVGVALAVGAVGAFVPGFFSDLKAEVESGGGQMVTGYVAKRDFMNQKLFDGVEDLPREVSEVQAIAIVPSLRQLRRSLLESSAGGLHAWTNGAFVPVDSEPPAERTLVAIETMTNGDDLREKLLQMDFALRVIENNALMAQEARKLPRCGLILFSGSLESFSTVLEKTSPDDPTFTEKVYLQHVSKKDAADREEERLMELKRRWAELALPPETFKGL